MEKLISILLIASILGACQGASIKNESLTKGVYKLTENKQGKSRQSYYLFLPDDKFRVLRDFNGGTGNAIHKLRNEMTKSQWFIAGSLGIQYRVQRGSLSLHMVEPLELDSGKNIKLGQTKYGVVQFIPF